VHDKIEAERLCCGVGIPWEKGLAILGVEEESLQNGAQGRGETLRSTMHGSPLDEASPWPDD